MSQPRSVFIDEGVLDLNYIPPRLRHREEELRFLKNIFHSVVDAPYEMSQRAIIVGGIGTGKTALAQRFGLDLEREAAQRRVKAKYIHVNCREKRGSLFMALNQAVREIRPEFPDRGFSANELLDILMRILDEEGQQLVLCLDEVDALIEKEGGDALYNLTRVQEERMEGPRRLSIICISKSIDAFRGLDRSTLSTLQRNIVTMPEYTKAQLADILSDRVERAFRPGAVSEEVVKFVSELAEAENGDARYAIDLIWGAGKRADTAYSREVLPDHVRMAAAKLFPTLRDDEVQRLSRHEQLVLLGIARHFRHSREAHATTGEVELSYQVVCEEYGEEPRGHTQFWKYLNQLKWLDAVSSRLDASDRGRTQLVSLSKVSAEDLERVVKQTLEGR